MAVLAGRHQLGPDQGRIVLRTFRDGLAAQAGHDLTIEATRWSGVLTVNEDLSPADLDVRIDMSALVVRDGTGGVKPLSDRDRREIAVTARKVLASDRHPEAVLAAAGFEPAAGEGGEISGTLTIRGQARPVKVHVTQTGEGRYHAEAQVLQSDYGIKPYTAFLGALRVRDAVDVAVDLDLSDQAADSGAGS
jgi:polyisoprenoid-binding protein YceI